MVLTFEPKRPSELIQAMGRGARSFDQSTKATILVKGDDNTEVNPKDFMDGLEDLENLRMMNGQTSIRLSNLLHDV